MRARRLWLGASLVAGVLLVAGVTSAIAVSARAHKASSYVCRDPYPATRDPSNPLALPIPPGANPLHGANFFIDGPAHGAAAGAIAELLGLNPKNFPDTYSWAQFKNDLDNGRYAARVAADPALAYKVHNLEKIASQPAANRFSAFSQGGSPHGIYSQAIKIFCHNMQADPGSVPILTTYFLHPATPDHCPPPSMLRAAQPLFKQRIDAMARATGNRPAVYLVELDGIGSSRCIQKVGSLKLWEADLRYETSKLAALPHTVVYMEAGYSDGNPVGYTAKVLNAGGVRNIRGFWTNDTHLNWTIDEIKWGEKISRRTHGADFVVNTAQNGNGPKRNPHPTTQGNEDHCNPPGRALGPPPTTDTGFAQVDAFLWSSPPGNSGGSCRGGPPAGTFWAQRAIDLAAHANDRLGPGYPSRPY
jgi:endoglucanase